VSPNARSKRGESSCQTFRKKLQGYQPPAGFKAVKCTADEATGVDWAVLNANTELELWAVRVPVGVSSRPVPAKFLVGLPLRSLTRCSTP
jgi:hypothetical protein